MAKAVKEGRLIRNFMGYAVAAGSDLLGFGPSAISNVAGVYSQNEKVLTKWERTVNGGHFAVHKGHRLNDDDLMRRWLIHELMGTFELRWDVLAARYGVDGPSLFPDALEELKAEEPFGTVDVRPEGRVHHPPGPALRAQPGAALRRLPEAPRPQHQVLENGVRPRTAVVLLNLGGPLRLRDVEPFMYRLFADREIIRFPGPAFLQPLFATLLSRGRAREVRGRYREIGGGSPILRETAAQAAALRAALRAAGRTEPVKIVFRYTAAPGRGHGAGPEGPGHPAACCRSPSTPTTAAAPPAPAWPNWSGKPPPPGWKCSPESCTTPPTPTTWRALAGPLAAALARTPRATVVFSAHSLPARAIAAGRPLRAGDRRHGAGPAGAPGPDSRRLPPGLPEQGGPDPLAGAGTGRDAPEPWPART